jgi:hypothetical protein
MCTLYLHHIQPPTPFLHHLPHPTGTTSPQIRWVPTSNSQILQKKGKRHDIFACLGELHRELPCDTSIYIYVL